jgi:hypothetical protein
VGRIFERFYQKSSFPILAKVLNWEGILNNLLEQKTKIYILDDYGGVDNVKRYYQKLWIGE